MAPQTLVQHLNSLHAEKLFPSVELLSGFLMTVLKNNSDVFTPANHYEILLHHANAKYKRKLYRSAEFHYKQALIIRKSGMKQKGMASSFTKLPSENDVKYKMHLCCQGLKDNADALSILESIPPSQRSVKVHHALAKMYQNLGHTRMAIHSYKEVLKKSPLALDVALNLLTLGENINDLIPILSSATQGSDWILSLIKGFAMMQNKEYNKSFSQLDVANRKSAIAGDTRLHCYLGKLRVKTGNYKSAMLHFENARMTDTHLVDDMDIYAYLLHEEGEHEKLDKLAGQLFSISELHPAAWVALGYRALNKGDYKRAVYLAVEATKYGPNCVEALVLKGCALRAIEEVNDAINHFREASRIDPTRFNCYKELIETFLSIPKPRVREAVEMAHTALTKVGSQPNCLALYASACMMEENEKERAQIYINKALTQDPNNQYAIIVKGNILLQQEKFEEAIKFLSSCVENHVNSSMHTLLGNCYQKTKNYAKAVDHYMIALSLNPDSKEASDGMSNITNLQQEMVFEENDTHDTVQLPNDAEDGNSDSDIMYTEE